MAVTFDWNDSFCERLSKIVNSDHLTVPVKIKVSDEHTEVFKHMQFLYMIFLHVVQETLNPVADRTSASSGFL